MRNFFILSSLATASFASANVQIFVGNDVNPAPPLADPVDRVTRTNSDAAYNSFLGAIGGSAGSEGFESLADGVQGPTVAMNFGGGRTGTFESTSKIEIFNQPVGTINGGYPADGNKFISVITRKDEPNTTTLKFNQDTKALGFYINDLELSTIKVKFNYTDSTSETKDILLPNYPADGYISGNMAFWGGVTDKAFRSVDIYSTLINGSNENINFDKFTASPVPEPTTMAILAGAGLLALRRRRKQSS